MDTIDNREDLSKIEGIVLKEMPYSESSKLLKIFCKDMGMITVLAKGAQNIRNPIFPIARPFIIGNFKLSRGSSFYYLNEGEIIASNDFLRTDIKLLSYAILFVDLMDTILPVQIASPRLYQLLVRSLDGLSKTKDFKCISLAFLLKLNSILGYQPSLKTCIKCGADRFYQVGFSITEGGIVCQNCFSTTSLDNRLSQKQVKSMICLLARPFQEADCTDVSEQEKKELLHLILQYTLAKQEIVSMKVVGFLQNLGEI